MFVCPSSFLPVGSVLALWSLRVLKHKFLSGSVKLPWDAAGSRRKGRTMVRVHASNDQTDVDRRCAHTMGTCMDANVCIVASVRACLHVVHGYDCCPPTVSFVSLGAPLVSWVPNWPNTS